MADNKPMVLQGWTDVTVQLDGVAIQIPSTQKMVCLVLRGAPQKIADYVTTNFTESTEVTPTPTSEILALDSYATVMWMGSKNGGSVLTECRYWEDENFPTADIDNILSVVIDLDLLLEDQKDPTVLATFLQQ
jgi:hypothetical protein